MGDFPKYGTHDEARCFKCDGRLTDPQESGFPKGRGEYVAECPECLAVNWIHRTWYDLEE